MLNILWAFMILTGIIYGCLTGRMSELSNAALESSQEAVSLCITMLGVMSFWVGLMQIATKSGLISSMTKKIRPLLLFIFPRLKNESKALEYISTNVIANILGLGWACTPAGLKAMEELSIIARKNSALKDPSFTPCTKEMCNFLILNISSLQLIPVNILVYRSKYGSVSPSFIIFPAILATCVSTLTGIIFIKICERF